MEFVHVGVPPSNYCTDDPPSHATALVDMGALHLRLPESLARQMDLPFDRFRRVTYADGRSMEAPYVGPIRIEVATGSVLSAPWCLGMRSCWSPFPWKIWTCGRSGPTKSRATRPPGPVSAAKLWVYGRFGSQCGAGGSGREGPAIRLTSTPFPAKSVNTLVAGFPLPHQPRLPDWSNWGEKILTS